MIKAIAVDMDGTFLDQNSEYNRVRFAQLFEEMIQRGIRFIVASGNQYAQLRSFFPQQRAAITFVSENGALIFQQGQLVAKQTFARDLVQEIINSLVAQADLEFILCGVEKAYLLASASEEFKQFAAQYYFALAEVASFATLPQDEFVKLALNVPVAATKQIVTELNQQFSGRIKAVASGHGSIDIIIPGVTKGAALQRLLSQWQLTSDELLAFGDANNDLEMLALTEHSYAMAESSEEVAAIAKHRAPSHNEEGVLQIIQWYLSE
ncbi:phosphatase YbjI [Enterococcus canis]|uniref:Phosphatase YbjI n=1 Tax=Enterococcus canis TaxID=214095 RepID=A0A1L8RD31_9ENTE|nr:Cof-type HAD-IIB family hydrolase [Enterococcus canis]OJG17658.1 phosphatase YbjI [Enterococcus canis]